MTPPTTNNTRAWHVPSTLLVSLRQSSVRYERPLWDILLNYEETWPLSIVSAVSLFAGGTLAFVSSVLCVGQAEVEHAVPQRGLQRALKAPHEGQPADDPHEVSTTPSTAEVVMPRRRASPSRRRVRAVGSSRGLEPRFVKVVR